MKLESELVRVAYVIFYLDIFGRNGVLAMFQFLFMEIEVAIMLAL